MAASYGDGGGGNGRTYLTQDQLGSTRVVSAQDSAPDQSYIIHDYFPFGDDLVPNSTNGRTGLAPYTYSTAESAMVMRFTGKERDDTGLDYFGARYFSGAQGRFTSPDWSAAPGPIPYADLTDPQTLNLYSYVRNNPLSKADLDGHGDLWARIAGYYAGVGKGWVNGHLDNQTLLGKVMQKLGVQKQVATNPVQAIGMEDSSTVIGLAAIAIPGPKGVRENYAAGKAFEVSVAAETAEIETAVQPQIMLETKSGTRTVMDVVSTDPAGNVALREAKASATAPLSKNQRIAHPEIGETGATVVGKGKPPYTGGTTIPPTKVQVVRPPNQE